MCLAEKKQRPKHWCSLPEVTQLYSHPLNAPSRAPWYQLRFHGRTEEPGQWKSGCRTQKSSVRKARLVLSIRGESRKHQRMWSSGVKGPQDFCRAKGIQVLVKESMEKEHGCKASWKTLLKESVPNITMSQERRHVLLLAGRKRKWLCHAT